MKKLTLLYLILFSTVLFSQEEKGKENDSKMKEFISQTGVILKFEDYDLPRVKLSYGIAESKVRKITSGDRKEYFLQISKKGDYGTKTASIAYEDLLEIMKALVSLNEASKEDVVNTNSDYLENKFITEDGFQVGYFVSSNKLTWYMKLEKYGSGTTIFIKDFETLEQSFLEGKNKIELLKKD